MKRIIAGLSALAIAAAMAPMAAFAVEPNKLNDPISANTGKIDFEPTIIPPSIGGTSGTEIKPDPDNTPNPKPASADTSVEFSVDPAYTVTIPAKVELVNLAPLADGYIGSGDITAEKVRIGADQRIVVKMNTDFLLENEKKPDYQVPYRAYVHLGEGVAENLEDDRIVSGGKVAEFAASLDEQAESLAFAVPEDTEIQYAGKYTDTVTFNISVETAK